MSAIASQYNSQTIRDSVKVSGNEWSSHKIYMVQMMNACLLSDAKEGRGPAPLMTSILSPWMDSLRWVL